jgi:hypothetical protein
MGTTNLDDDLNAGSLGGEWVCDMDDSINT